VSVSEDLVGGKDWNRDGRIGRLESFIGHPTAFARDVAINILANVIAGGLVVAVVYLFGVLTGWFPLNILAYVTAVWALSIAIVLTGVWLVSLPSRQPLFVFAGLAFVLSVGNAVYLTLNFSVAQSFVLLIPPMVAGMGTVLISERLRMRGAAARRAAARPTTMPGMRWIDQPVRSTVGDRDS
jgi:hypothetical protein